MTPNTAPAQYSGAGATARNMTPHGVTAIASLSQYGQNRPMLRGRCTMKGELKEFRRKDGKAGNVFNFDLMDSTGEIRCVGFGREAQTFYEQVLGLPAIFQEA